ncbi:class I tRNA ligase family protein [Candidatus Vidania fulgoroideorum]
MKKKSNINLNKVSFELKGNLRNNIKKIDKKWKEEKIYEKILMDKKRKKKITIHDGPPYANGKIHLGHAINKIIKDVIVKKYISLGYKVFYLPGWDCHGLPIEINVGKKKKIEKYRKYANKQIKIQKTQFKKLGCLYYWRRIYKTMDPNIQYKEIKFLYKLLKNKKIFIKKEIINFCEECNSSLSNFELESEEKKLKTYFIVVKINGKNVILKSFFKKISKVFIDKKTRFIKCFILNNFFYLTKNTLITLNIKCFTNIKKVYSFKETKLPKLNKEYIVLKGKKKVNFFFEKKNTCPVKICWRHKKKVIKKIKKQFFIDVKIKKDTINSILFYPKNTKKKFLQNVFKRPNWNISRRRTWGVPITLFIKGKKAIFFKKIARYINKFGVKVWKIFKIKSKKYKKCKDILDVWFDSGVTHYTVLKKNFPADIYIEGKDQHRGWFNASFITSQLVNNISPFKKLITHGFAVDNTGKKMSKSKGNYTDLENLLDKYNTEIIRLFVSSSNFFKDISISDEKINNIRFDYIKIRSIIKFCIQNIQDLKKTKKTNIKLLIDRYFIYKFKKMLKKFKKYDEKFEFFRSFNVIKKFLFKNLSNFYFSNIKDRLYILQRKSEDRISCQTSIKCILREILILFSPYISYTSEEAWRKCFKKSSIFLAKQRTLKSNIKAEEILAFKKLIKFRKQFDNIKENDKNKRVLYIMCNKHYIYIKKMEREVKYFFHNYKNIVLKDKNEGIMLGKKKTNSKCKRCWNFITNFFDNEKCKRCFYIEKKKKIKPRKYF